MTNNKKAILSTILTLAGASGAWAQVPYDPPTSQKAAPNVMLILDATRTTLINGSACRGFCHGEDGSHPEYVGYLYQHGQTRLQLARRVLTGGWGYNTPFVSDWNANGSINDGRNTTGGFTCSTNADCNSSRCIDHDFNGGTPNRCDPDSGPADGIVRRDGVMDQYRVRWGVIYYDGLGPRMVQPPTIVADDAQKRVIDFMNPGFGENLGAWAVSSPLNSWLPFHRTTTCCGNYQGTGLLADLTDGRPTSIPWYNEAGTGAGSAGRITRALMYTRDYLDSRGARYPQHNQPGVQRLAYGPPPWEATPGVSLIPGDAFRGDVSNVLNQPAPAGCRRNFTILLTDGHGGGDYAGKSRGQVAQEIFDMNRNNASALPNNLRNQVFAIWFGSVLAEKANADTVADCGFDGVCGNGPLAFNAAPGGAIEDLTPMYAAFTAIFQLVLSGTYLGTPPTITRSGDRFVTSTFKIQDCSLALPNTCNIGRIGGLAMDEVVYPDPNDLTVQSIVNTIRFSDVLRGTAYNFRNVITSVNAAVNNCGAQASCGIRTANHQQVLPTVAPGNTVPSSPPGALTHSDFLRGNPNALFANGVARANVANGNTPGPLYTDPYKLMDIANSQPVIVGAPAGIGEDLARWEAFLDQPLSRTMPGGWNQKGGGFSAYPQKVMNRDQVVYIGGNDGLLHAFLAGVASGTPEAGRTASYPLSSLPICAQPTGSNPAQNNVRDCIGTELWAYSPRLVQPFWNDIRSGHFFMVDGTPTVSDVMFTKNTNVPGSICKYTGPGTGLFSAGCTSRWEFRTVLLQCLGGGGPGCFAMDVSNPYNPQILWERSLTIPLASPGGSIRAASTSRPQIVRVKKIVGGQVIPYYVGIMGGGIGETDGTNRTGSLIALGMEDGAWYSSQAKAINGDFAGAPTCLDTDGDSFTDTCYIATTQAEIYKARIAPLTPGGLGNSTAITIQKFFDGRAHLQTPAGGGHSAAVANAIRTYGRVVATFDRARDLRLYYATGNFEDVQNPTERNFMFAVVDALPEGPLNVLTPALNLSRAISSCGTGGVIPLPVGEKVVFDPVISNGVAVFTSYAPNPNPCLPGTSYLNGVTVDSCDPGIDADGDGTAESGVPGGSRASYVGLAVAPVINEHTGGITVATNSNAGAQVNHNQGFTRRLPAPPVSKLWWRILR